MKNGLAVIEKNDTETKGFYIDQDVLECTRQNAKVAKRLDEAEKAKQKAIAEAEKARKAYERKMKKAEAEKAKRRAYTLDAVRVVASSMALCVAVVWAGTADMIHPAIYIPVALVSLCAACLRLGALFGKVVK